MADGKVIIETGLDITGATKDLKSFGDTIKKEGKEIPSIKPEVDEEAKTKTKADIDSLVEEVNKILNDLKGKITNRIIIKRLFKVKL